MCGIVGLVAKSSVNRDLYDALTMLQHRGQDAAGMMTCDGDRLYLRKGIGLVRDVFNKDQHMIGQRGNMGIAHVRYPTAGITTTAETQPLYTNTPYGISLAHNGNLTNTAQLRQALFQQDRRHVNTDSDTDVLLNVFAHEVMQSRSPQLTPDDVFDAVGRVHQRAHGAYACVAMIANYGVVGFRDPFGIRPVVYGRRMSAAGPEYMIASESVALDSLGFEIIADIAPGEAVLITQDGQIHVRQCATNPMYSPCIFEYVYLSRPDSVLDGIYVYKSRLRMGEALAHKIQREWPDHDIDVVIPIPDTSRVAGSELANQLGVKYREGFIKNRYIGRTFIMPGQEERRRSVRQKLNAIDLEFSDKNVLLIDDSIVRGTTSHEIIEMAREAGARKVYFASAAPPVRYPNVYGIDMPSASELIAHGRSVEELQTLLGADRLIYQNLDDLIEAVRHKHSCIERFDTSIFTGEYVTHDVDNAYLRQLELFRSDAAKTAARNGSTHDNTGDNVVELSQFG